MSVEFHDYSRIVIQKINECGVKFLEEASGELEAQVKRNTKVDTGKTKGSWEHVVHEHKLEAEVGSRYKNALWEEFGTGIYALNGNGRKTKWVYKHLMVNIILPLVKSLEGRYTMRTILRKTKSLTKLEGGLRIYD